MNRIISTIIILVGAYHDLDTAERAPEAEGDILGSDDHNHLVNY